MPQETQSKTKRLPGTQKLSFALANLSDKAIAPAELKAKELNP